jgi:hypothetical protein
MPNGSIVECDTLMPKWHKNSQRTNRMSLERALTTKFSVLRRQSGLSIGDLTGQKQFSVRQLLSLGKR